ncbi:hypothetical protein AB4298_07230 [Shewanella sp. 10N.261.52.F9]|uniref:hypothetical protein n=1 Tax=Shewanella TaxID=22 RepID=UPI00200DFE98|nr:hypothetical protein [Shewanella marinintestina]MCL1147783.1 hypothetical protein [Shewanella marinintestina]
MTNKPDTPEINFKAKIKQHIENQSLSDSGIARVEALLTDIEQSELLSVGIKNGAKNCDNKNTQADTAAELANEPRNRGWHSYRSKPLLTVAASIFLLIVLGAQFYSHIIWQSKLGNPFGSAKSSLIRQTMDWKIAEEVAKNHIKMKPLEVQTQRLSDLRDYFIQLDFKLVSSRLITNNSQMLGGRYCSIQGLTAAQIRFVEQDKAITLYEVQYDQSLYGKLPMIEAGDKPIEHIVRGVLVSIWVEKGLLMASARSIE